MANTKKQHYVPQFYLKNFANANDQVYLFDKFTKKSFLANVRDIASERYFYDFPLDQQENSSDGLTDADIEITYSYSDNSIDHQIVEKTLSVLESDFAKVLGEILDAVRKRGPIDEEQKITLAYFITIQLLRTTGTRQMITELSEILLSLTLEAAPELAEQNLRIKFNPKFVALEHATSMFDPNLQLEIMQILLGHIWMIGINDTDFPLYTSDEPVVKIAHNGPGYAGIGSFGIEIVFPITPKYILILADRNAYKLLSRFDSTYTALDRDNIKRYNSLQILQSYRQVYCSIGDLSFAAEVCAENPEVCNPDRKRLQPQTLPYRFFDKTRGNSARSAVKQTISRSVKKRHKMKKATTHRNHGKR